MPASETSYLISYDSSIHPTFLQEATTFDYIGLTLASILAAYNYTAGPPTRRLGVTMCFVVTPVFILLPFYIAPALAEHIPQSPASAVSLCTPAFGIAAWCYSYGRELRWYGRWNFRHPLKPPSRNLGAPRPYLPGASPTKYSRIRGARIRTMGAATRLVGHAGVIAGLFLFCLQDARWNAPVGILSMVICGWLYSAGQNISIDGRRYQSRILSTTDSLSPGSYVLYLRSFQDDKGNKSPPEVFSRGTKVFDYGTSVLFLTGRSREEQLTDALKPVGEVLALGAPGETLPYVGATRMYLPMADWKKPVLELMRNARLVVILLGKGQGTMWELVEAANTLEPQRVIVIDPGFTQGTYQELRAKYIRIQRMRDGLSGNSGICALLSPRQERRPSINHFSETWEPHRNTFREPIAAETFFHIVSASLTPALKQLLDHEKCADRDHS